MRRRGQQNPADEFFGSMRNLLMGDEILELLAEGLLTVATSIVTAITSFEDYEDAVEAATGSSKSAAVAMGMLEDFALNTSPLLRMLLGRSLLFEPMDWKQANHPLKPMAMLPLVST